MSNPATTGRELDELLQGAFGDVQLPDRPTGFPAGLPEPVFMNNGMIAAVNVGTSQEESQTYLIFKDTETDRFVLMTAPDAVKMFNAAFDPLHDEIFSGDVTPLREHRMQYGGAINSRTPEGHRGPIASSQIVSPEAVAQSKLVRIDGPPPEPVIQPELPKHSEEIGYIPPPVESKTIQRILEPDEARAAHNAAEHNAMGLSPKPKGFEDFLPPCEEPEPFDLAVLGHELPSVEEVMTPAGQQAVHGAALAANYYIYDGGCGLSDEEIEAIAESFEPYDEWLFPAVVENINDNSAKTGLMALPAEGFKYSDILRQMKGTQDASEGFAGKIGAAGAGRQAYTMILGAEFKQLSTRVQHFEETYNKFHTEIGKVSQRDLLERLNDNIRRLDLVAPGGIPVPYQGVAAQARDLVERYKPKHSDAILEGDPYRDDFQRLKEQESAYPKGELSSSALPAATAPGLS